MDNSAGVVGVLLFFVMLGSVAFWVWICHLIAKAAKAKGRSYAGFFCLSFFFSPLLGWIIVLSMAKAPAGEPAFNAGAAGISGPFALHNGVELFKCPKCAEWVKAEAVVCRFCGSDISKAIVDARAIQHKSLEIENAARTAAAADALKERQAAQLAEERAIAAKHAKMAASREKLMRVLRSKKIRKFSIVAAVMAVVISIGSALVAGEMYKQGLKYALLNTDPPTVVGLTSLGYDPNAGGEDVSDWARGAHTYAIELEHPLFSYLDGTGIDGVVDPIFNFELIIDGSKVEAGQLSFEDTSRCEFLLNLEASKRITAINNEVNGQIIITRREPQQTTVYKYDVTISGRPHTIEVVKVSQESE